MRTLVILFAVAMMASSCVSTSAIFQDGKTLGKDSVDGNISITLNSVPNYAINEDSTKKTEISANRKLVAPWINLQMQGGLTERLDAGGGLGIGFFTVGVQGFLKYSLLPKESKAGIALLAHGSATVADDLGTGWFDEEDLSGVNFLTSSFGMPVSVPVGSRTTFILNPMYTIERICLKEKMPEGIEKSVLVLKSYRLGTSLIIKRERGPLQLNVTTAYYPDSKVVVPILGIAFSPFVRKK